ncbi:cysteine-rich receptor-like protein kinase 44 [Silene latifolia]|uniref:cysteine-rich receptor-like protein kinase 44 n=1 Tax=Silene latifolia TaxID=37657 RepID=UPI003D784F42
MDDIIKNTSSMSPHYDFGNTNWTSSRQLYSFAQCTPDIDRIECTNSSKRTIGIIVAISVCVPFALIVLFAILWIRLFRKRTKGGSSGAPLASPRGLLDNAVNGDAYNYGEIEFMEYDFATLKNATRDFSNENALGEGGFGTVYKGVLENGRPLAIKRLSVASGQRRDDFMSSVDLLAELRHSNLARLVGFCYEGDEKLLVYELMSNASLDRFLFDARKRPLLGWLARYNIILGIAKGLQYLHEDSHLSIVHGHLKPNNILLDRDMNPKITDFGLDKLLDVARVPRRNTSRIVRTKGYVAPENRTLGSHSKESDVYSFGIMLLETAWRLWNDGRPFDLTDPALYNNCSSNDVIRCIQIGLLCVQANANQRPTMPTVVTMLAGYVDIPLPSAPETSSHQLDMGTESYSDDQQSDHDQAAAKTVTWRTEFEQDLYPTRPR